METPVIVVSSSDDEREADSVVVNVSSSSNERRIEGANSAARKKKRRRRSKKKRRKMDTEAKIELMWTDKHSETTTTVDTDAVGCSASVTRADEPSKTFMGFEDGLSKDAMWERNYLGRVGAINIATAHALDNVVMVEVPLTQIQTIEGTGIYGSAVLPEKNLEDGRSQLVVVIDLLSSSDEIDNKVVKKKKTKRSKKKKIHGARCQADVARVAEPSENNISISKQAGNSETSMGRVSGVKNPYSESSGIVENDTRLENHLMMVEAMSAETTVTKDDFIRPADSMEKHDTVKKDSIDRFESPVFKKLLRGPRYFDSPDDYLGKCYYCCEEGHVAADCSKKKQKKPCYSCGKIGHVGKDCTERQQCSTCRRRGHLAKDCSEKHQRDAQNCQLCLRCGDPGHDMSFCKNDYVPDDMKLIQCYICNNFGHLCCVNNFDVGSQDVSCYNCGQSGHIGGACAKLRGESNHAALPVRCYNCGENGHLARGCAKSPISQSARWRGHPSKAAFGYSNEARELYGYRSAPYDIGKAYKWVRKVS